MDRINKVNQAVKREVSDILHREMQDPRLEFVTVTAAEVSRDLQHAKIFFSVLGDEARMREAQIALNSACGHVRKLVGQRVRMRYTPEIEFILDKSIEYGIRIEKTIERIKREFQSDPQDSSPA